MGAMTACMGESNEKYSSKEIKFNITKRPNSSIKMNRKQYKHKSRSNSQNNSVTKEKDEEEYNNDFELFKFEEARKPNYQIPKSKKKNSNYINGSNFKEKVRGYSSGLKQINKNEEDCDIIECEDEFECDQNILDLIKNVDVTNNKRMNYFYDNNANKNNNKNNNIVFKNIYNNNNNLTKNKKNENLE